MLHFYTLNVLKIEQWNRIKSTIIVLSENQNDPKAFMPWYVNG